MKHVTRTYSSGTDLFAPVVSRLFKRLFPKVDWIGIATKVGDERATWKGERVTAANALPRLMPHHGKLNLYFTPSVFRPDTEGLTNDDVLAISAFVFDVDFGTTGHNAKSPYETREDALEAIHSASNIPPSLVCDTGNGFHVYYILEERLLIHGNPEGVQVFNRIAKALNHGLGADSAPSMNGHFRIPATSNCKPGGNSDARIITENLNTAYRIGDLLEYATSVLPKIEERRVYLEVEADEGDCPSPVELLERLPDDLRANLLRPDHADKSKAFHGLVADLKRFGFSKREIKALAQNHAAAERYGHRLGREVDRSFDKISNQQMDALGAIDPLRVPEEVSQKDLRPLSQGTKIALSKYLQRYCGNLSPQKSVEIEETAHFVDDRIFRMIEEGQGTAIDEAPGRGKSVAAICHIAAHANDERRYLLAVESLEKLDETAKSLRELAPVLKVAVYHGWRENQCHSLSGRPTKSHQTAPRKRDEEEHQVTPTCRFCPGRDQCDYHNRIGALDAPVMITTHESTRRLLARGHLSDRWLIIDEAPSLYVSETIESEEVEGSLLTVSRDTGVDIKWKALINIFRRSATLPPSASNQAGLQPHDFLHIRLETLRRTEGFRSTLRDINYALRKLMEVIRRGLPGHNSEQALQALKMLRRLKGLFGGSGNDDLCLQTVSPDGKQATLYAKRRLTSLEPELARRAILLGADIANDPSLPKEMMVVRRPLPLGRPDLRLHILDQAYFATKLEPSRQATLEILRATNLGMAHEHVLACRPKVQPGCFDETRWPEAFEYNLREILKQGVTLSILDRGQFKGTNKHAEATLVLLTTVPFFTTIADVAMTLALRRGYSLLRRQLYTESGYPFMSQGRFVLHEFHRLVMLNCLSSLNQALNRSAIRQGNAVDAILCIPDLQTLSLFWRVFRTGFTLETAWSHTVEEGIFEASGIKGFIRLVQLSPKEKVCKQDAAALLGYPKNNGDPKRAWPNAREVLIPLLEPFFDIQHKVLVRNDAYHGIAP